MRVLLWRDAALFLQHLEPLIGRHAETLGHAVDFVAHFFLRHLNVALFAAFENQMLIDEHLEHFVAVVQQRFGGEVVSRDLFAVHDGDDLRLGLVGRLGFFCFGSYFGGRLGREQLDRRACLGRVGFGRAYPHGGAKGDDGQSAGDTLKPTSERSTRLEGPQRLGHGESPAHHARSCVARGSILRTSTHGPIRLAGLSRNGSEV